ncbi:uncharacterized protein CTRU02_213957 [Colletotrichum truncatum]|uniref:Uncharacterized protein n=1 Tax=Colletotrichum truncatum TaxID=5467 RepID=A0ACC3YH65_COLTU|nr:uncharacterized protein CTRU02_06269 [Colletotrichum truncatum]KAF6792773.1 hypothetical protein CTRU02_06269 [Colletotrichum truncatum]
MGWEDAVVMPTAWQEAINKLDEMYQRCATDDLFKPMGSCCEPFRLGRPLMYPRHSLGYGHSCPESDGPSCFADPSDPHSSKSKTGPFKRMKRRLTNLL